MTNFRLNVIFNLFSAEQLSLDNDRYVITTTGTTPNDVTSLCYPDFGATGQEYEVIIKSGKDTSCAYVNLIHFFLFVSHYETFSPKLFKTTALSRMEVVPFSKR